MAASVAAESSLGQFSFFDRSDSFDVEEPELESVPEFLFARVQFQTMPPGATQDGRTTIPGPSRTSSGFSPK